MAASPTLLAAHEGNGGPFVAWLKKLGLGDFLQRYPLLRLVEWGWVVPQYRVYFPPRFFESWEQYPCTPWSPPEELELYSILWDYSWWIDESGEPLWFLDPLFHPDDRAGRLLAQNPFNGAETPAPALIDHVRGVPIAPYVDYFHRWQGYALVDVIRRADSIEPILATPDILEAAQGIVRIAEDIHADQLSRPRDVLDSLRQWGGLAVPMTWLSHFKAFRDAFFDVRHSNAVAAPDLYSQGATSLARHLGVTPENLEAAIKGQFLVLAHDWMASTKGLSARSIWAMKAWPCLQADLMLAMSWLSHLTGKTFEDYSAKWRMPYMGDWGWAKLEDALPFAFARHQQTFIRLAPRYLEPFKDTPSAVWDLETTRLAGLVSRLQRENYPFGGFLAAFHELHEHLAHRPSEESGLDFRERRPLDYFAQLAIHAEGCLRRGLDSLGLLDAIPSEQHDLFMYIVQLAEAGNLPEGIIEEFRNHRRLGSLRKDRDDPIGRIQSLQLGPRTNAEQQLTKAFLSCLLARNYFAHHDFLDHELLHNDKATFLMNGILLTVLVLLNPRVANEQDRDAPV